LEVELDVPVWLTGCLEGGDVTEPFDAVGASWVASVVVAVPLVSCEILVVDWFGMFVGKEAAPDPHPADKAKAMMMVNKMQIE